MRALQRLHPLGQGEVEQRRVSLDPTRLRTQLEFTVEFLKVRYGLQSVVCKAAMQMGEEHDQQ